MPGFKRIRVNGNEWVIPDIYQLVGPLGAGSYGQVAKVRLQDSPNHVAMKKLLRPFETSEHAKRVYREIRLLKHMDHVNVISLLDTFHPPSPSPTPTMDDFQQVYLVTHLMSEDLHSFTRRVVLSDHEVKVILYKILRGIKYIHSAGVLHRDLKPGNIAVNPNLEVRILDFGMARVSAEDMTDFVGTLWYRAPELLFCWDQYTKAIDMWSVGCILAELLLGRALFPSTHSLNQLELVLNFTGKPSDEFISGIKDSGARQYVERYPYPEGRSFQQRFPGVDPVAVNLMEKMLEMIPDKRITADEAMNHPYLRDLIEPDHYVEDTAPAYDQNFENMNLPAAGILRRGFEKLVQIDILKGDEKQVGEGIVRWSPSPSTSVSQSGAGCGHGSSTVPRHGIVPNEIRCYHQAGLHIQQPFFMLSSLADDETSPLVVPDLHEALLHQVGIKTLRY